MSFDALDRLWLLRQGAIDAWSMAVLKEFKASCGKGCCACCHQVVVCSSWEADLLLTVLSPSLVLEAVQQAERQEVVLRQDDGLAKWYAMKEPCALLDKGTGLCSAYAYRPTACATLWVTTPKELCTPGCGALTEKISNVELLEYVDLLEREWTQGNPRWGLLGQMLKSA